MNSRTDGSVQRDKYVKIFTVPGLYNSGPEHWQSRWEREFLQIERITQRDWNRPICAEWIAEVDKAVTTAGHATVVLAAHSLGCATVAHWAKVFNRAIRGALLVAPSDVEAPSYPPGTAGFVPMPLEKLPFTSIVVASSDDPYVAVDRARFFANSWGSEYVELERAGHINAASGLGMWNYGLRLLERLVDGGLGEIISCET
jgi:uncharacterized protein